MLAVFFMVFGCIGVVLNWPVIQDGVFKLLTAPLGENFLLWIARQTSAGYTRPDGLLLIGFTVLVLFSAFLRTRRFLLNLRILILVMILGILAAEVFTVVHLKYPLHAFTGLLYAGLFYLLALVSAIFRFGSMKSFNSTLMGKPMSESRVFSQTFSQVLDRMSGILQINLESVDDINTGLGPGRGKQFESPEIKIGRDRSWADLKIGDQWTMVSGRHGVIRTIGKALVYEPVAGHYAFALDGKPFTSAREIPNPCQLNLVSGAGPEIRISSGFQKKPLVHPGTMLRAGEIARDEFKRLQATFKALVVMAVLALPLILVFSGIQKQAIGRYLDELKIEKERFVLDLRDKSGRIEGMQRESAERQKEIKRLQNRIRNLEQMNRGDQDEAADSKIRLARLKNQDVSGKLSTERSRMAKIIDIKLSSQRISIYFPGVTFFGDRQAVFLTGFFARDRSGKYVLVTERAKISGVGNPKNVKTFFFAYPNSWDTFGRIYSNISRRSAPVSEYLQEMEKQAARINLMVIDGRQWKPWKADFDGNAIVISMVKDLPGYLSPYVPVMNDEISGRDQLMIYGFKSGRKLVLPVDISGWNRSSVTVRAGAAAGYSGGLLIRVMTNGQYTVVGLSHTAGNAASSSLLKFMRF